MSKGCAVEWCERPHSAKGYCHAHRQQERKGITPGSKPLRNEYIPVAPFLPTINALLNEYEAKELARLLDVPYRTLFRYRAGDTKKIHPTLADKITQLAFNPTLTDDEGKLAAEWAQTPEGQQFVNMCRDGEHAA